jgi:hypothetical protein
VAVVVDAESVGGPATVDDESAVAALEGTSMMTVLVLVEARSLGSVTPY